jgi:hypothetical protein
MQNGSFLPISNLNGKGVCIPALAPDSSSAHGVSAFAELVKELHASLSMQNRSFGKISNPDGKVICISALAPDPSSVHRHCFPADLKKFSQFE